MNTEIKNVYFLGIGGIGMSALARYFLAKGYSVGGYDKVQTKLTEQLAEEGMDIHYVDDINIIQPKFLDKTQTLIVYTPAVPEHLGEFVYFKENNFSLMKRAKVLGEIANAQNCIAIAGTHGKTTISTITAHILNCSHLKCTAFLGGISSNYGTNCIININSNLVVAEADEFDRSFLNLFPNTAVISSVDADHLDIYGNEQALLTSFSDFASQINDNGNLIIKKGISLNKNLKTSVKQYTYALDDNTADFYAANIVLNNGLYTFDFVGINGLIIKDIKLGIPALFNVENAVAALAIASLQQVNHNDMKMALETFTGIKRRFQIHFQKENQIYIDDYAHHPQELTAAIVAARHIFPNFKITGIFQPHLFSRTKDFASEFAKSLSLLDELILLDIYPARELPLEGVSPWIIFTNVTCKKKAYMKFDDVLEFLKADPTKEVVMTLGAGDIDLMVPFIIDIFENPRVIDTSSSFFNDDNSED